MPVRSPPASGTASPTREGSLQHLLEPGPEQCAACIYMAAVGRWGFAPWPSCCAGQSAAARPAVIAKLPGFAISAAAGAPSGSDAPRSFKEFVVRTPIPAEALAARLSRRGVVLPLSRYSRKHDIVLLLKAKGRIKSSWRSLSGEGPRNEPQGRASPFSSYPPPVAYAPRCPTATCRQRACPLQPGPSGHDEPWCPSLHAPLRRRISP